MLNAKRRQSNPLLVTLTLTLLACTRPIASLSTARAPYEVAEKSLTELQADMTAKRVSSQQLVAAYFARMDQLDARGPSLHSVLSRNPRALDDARQLDEERAQGRVRGPLHGIPILIKDKCVSKTSAVLP